MIEGYAGGELSLTDRGRAVLRAMLPEAVIGWFSGLKGRRGESSS
jgi:hypothetical protein